MDDAMDDPVDPRELRISDADRHRVAEVLREAAGDGRIDLEELDERLEAAYAAKTYGDLVPITLDLPTHPQSHPASQPLVPRPAASLSRTPPGAASTWNTSVGVMSESRRVGVWDVGSIHNATAVMGSVVIDLREARFPAGEVVINAFALMGGVEVIVNSRTAVRVEGVGIMGAFQEGRARVTAEIDDDSPVVRVRGLALMGGVEVKREGPPDEPEENLLGR